MRARTLGRDILLEHRCTPATSAVFLTDTLTVTGDSSANSIVVAADVDGNLIVTDNGNPVTIQVASGAANKANLATIVVDAGAGNDSIVVERSVNTLDADGKLAASPNAVLRGGKGHDAITPKHGGFLGGVIGNPIIGNVVQEGGAGNDTLTSGFGNDVMFGNAGDDTLIWLPGTLLDVYEGGSGNDNGVIVGNDNGQGDAFVLSKHPTKAGRALFQRTNLIPFAVDMASCETVTLRTQSGDDTILLNTLAGTGIRRVVADTGAGSDSVDGSALGANIRLDAFGGVGNDTLVGGAGIDLLDGGDGDDVLVGGKGRDILLGGSGNDSLDGGQGVDLLIAGDGLDTLVGGEGRDRLFGGGDGDTFVLQGKDYLLDFNGIEGDTTA